MEFAIKEGRIEYIENNHEDFVAGYQRFSAYLQKHVIEEKEILF